MTTSYIIRPKPDAPSYVKNRLRDHGPEFTIETEGNPVAWDGQHCYMLMSVARKAAGASQWAGWIPVKHLEIEG